MRPEYRSASHGAPLADRDKWVARAVAEVPSLRNAVGGWPGWKELLAASRDEWRLWRGMLIHLEVLEVGGGAPTVIFHHGYAAYARFYLPFLGCLWHKGFNVVAPDRPGHGLSGGRRGDCTVAALARLTQELIRAAITPRFGGPVILMGSSAGGMLASCLLPYLEEEVAAAVCHNVHDPRHALPGLGAMAQAAAKMFPPLRFRQRWIPARIREGISTYPVFREWFIPGADPLAAYDQTLRSVLSMTAGYRAPKPLSALAIPVLALSGRADAMVPCERTRRAFDRLALRHGRFEVIDGGHMLLHERTESTAATVAAWLDEVGHSKTKASN